jgi:hypothetical protein
MLLLSYFLPDPFSDNPEIESRPLWIHRHPPRLFVIQLKLVAAYSVSLSWQRQTVSTVFKEVYH